MNVDPKQAFLDSAQWKGAVEGCREGMALKGFTADEDTIGSIALSVLIRFIGAGGYDPEGVEKVMAMVLCVVAEHNVETGEQMKQ